MILEQELNQLPAPIAFNKKYKNIYQAVHGYILDTKEFHLLVWDIQKRRNDPLKNLLTKDNHPAVIIRSKTTEIKIHKALVKTLNEL